MGRHYYAAQSPRGFANEVNIFKFDSKTARDLWVDEHRHDGGSSSACRGAHKVTAKRARKLINRVSYNRLIDMTSET